MRSRCAILTALVLALVLAGAPAIATVTIQIKRHGQWIDYHGGAIKDGNIEIVVSPKSGEVTAVFAQGDSEDSETQGETEGGEGQSGEEAETGSEEADTGEAATETGPPWTFQMARISLVLTLLLGLAIARWYYKLVASRQKGAA